MRDPAFWWRNPGAATALLAPAAALYGAIAAYRMTSGGARPGWRAPVPVVCVGNFTLGGTGKTPAAMALARTLIAAGEGVFFLSRGYGGRCAGPVRVGGHGAEEVGDEPLLLAGVAPTIMARDRRAGAADAGDSGASIIIMDDGLQNPSLAKDFALALVDGRRGIGNGRVFPAGPLRAPLAAQLDCVSAVLVIGAVGAPRLRVGVGAGAAADVVDAARRRGLPVFHGELRPDAAAAAALAGKPVLAFAGIADPEKFFATVASCGIPAAVRAAFPDHHRYTAAEIGALLRRAERERLVLLTTEKDVARMRGDGAAAELAARAVALPVTMEFSASEALGAAVLDAIRLRREERAASSRNAQITGASCCHAIKPRSGTRFKQMCWWK
jgi:tetraacyldisaccharide 4'-kinase